MGPAMRKAGPEALQVRWIGSSCWATTMMSHHGGGSAIIFAIFLIILIYLCNTFYQQINFQFQCNVDIILFFSFKRPIKWCICWSCTSNNEYLTTIYVIKVFILDYPWFIIFWYAYNYHNWNQYVKTNPTMYNTLKIFVFWRFFILRTSCPMSIYVLCPLIWIKYNILYLINFIFSFKSA